MVESLVELVLELGGHLGGVIENILGPKILSLILLVKDTDIKT